MQNLYLQIYVFLVMLGQLMILPDRELHPMTSNPSTSPLVDIIQGHFCKSFEALIKIVGCGWWLTVNAVSCQPWWGPLLCWWEPSLVVKIVHVGLNKIRSHNTFLQYFFHFYHISGIGWTLKIPYVFYHLEVTMKTQFLCCFMWPLLLTWFDFNPSMDK